MIRDAIENPVDVAVSGGYLYWTQPYPTRIISSCPLTACTPSSVKTAVSEGGLPQMVAVSGTTLTWSQSYAGGSVRSCVPVSGQCPSLTGTAIVDAQEYPGGLAWAGSTLLWTAYLPAPEGGEVRTCSGDCATDTQLAVLYYATSLAVWGDLVLMGSSQRPGIHHVSLSGAGGGVEVLINDEVHFARNTLGLTVEGDTLFWTSEGYPPALDGRIGRCELALPDPAASCSATATLVASDRRGPRGITATAGAVYWVELDPGPGGEQSPQEGRIMRLLR